MPPPHSVACYVAREHGLCGLRALLASQRYRPAAIVTHQRLPKVESPERAERPDFAQFESLAREHRVPLFVIDGTSDHTRVVAELGRLELDLIASISWRRLITKEQLAQPRLGGVNVHRGELPRYSGGLPIHRALQDGQPEIVVTAHVLVEEVDAGEVLATARHPVTRSPDEDLDACVERLKHEISVYFGPLLITAFDTLVSRHARA